MNLISEINEPDVKRLKFDDDCEKSYKGKNNFHEKMQGNNAGLSDSDDETSVANDDDESFTFPPDDDISDMLDEVQYNDRLPTVTDRYFTPYYKVNVQLPGDDICIRIHSNRICMLSLAPSHVALASNREIEKVGFKVSDKLDRSLNKVSGKGKHGAQPLQANSNICTISCTDGQAYVIKCCMIGKLIEVNEMLLENPQLLKQPPHKGGYLAIILPNIKLLESLKQSLLTEEQYVELIKDR